MATEGGFGIVYEWVKLKPSGFSKRTLAVVPHF